LVPRSSIREQTIKALRNPVHLYRSVLRDSGTVSVMELKEAKSVTQSTLYSSSTIIVATNQASQVEEEGSRKVYQSSSALLSEFTVFLLFNGTSFLPREKATIPRCPTLLPMFFASANLS